MLHCWAGEAGHWQLLPRSGWLGWGLVPSLSGWTNSPEAGPAALLGSSSAAQQSLGTCVRSLHNSFLLHCCH